MPANSGRLVLVALTTLVLSTIPAASIDNAQTGGGVEALFDVDEVSGSPFPSDMFTVPDHTQNTGVRVNLPKPACGSYPHDCVEIDLLNELDGFHIQPRASIPFSGLIDPASVTSETVFFLKLDGGRRGQMVGINEVVWDTTDFPYSLRVTANEVLEQHTRYALIATRGIREANGGDPVEPSAAFEDFRHDLNFGQTRNSQLRAYRKDLLDALAQAAAAGVNPQEVVVASVFTTQSVSASLEKIRDQIRASTPEAAQLVLPLTNSAGTPSGGTVRAVFNVADIITPGIVVNQQIGVLPDRFQTFSARLPQLRFIPGAVRTLAVGKFAAPIYARNGIIPPFGTRTGTPEVFGQNDVYFTAFLPAGAPPPGGWPVVLFGPGQPDDDMWGTPFNIAASLAAHGLATVSVQSAWHGYGAKSTVAVTLQSGSTGCPASGPCVVRLPAGGRNSDKNGDTSIMPGEGVIPYAFPADPHTILYTRDAWRQTAADTMQFINVLQKAGVDVDGDGVSDFDPDRIYYVGFSIGGSRGVALVAVEPSVKAAVFNSAAAPNAERLSPIGNRQFTGRLLEGHPSYFPRLSPPWSPSLLNPTGEPLVVALDCQINGERTPFCYDNVHGGIELLTTGATGGPRFNENLPLRDEPAVTNTVRGALDIQQYLERRAWLGAVVTPTAFAPYLRTNPLTGLVSRPVLVLFVRGDQTMVNPGTMAVLRAGDLADRATLFRNDLAYPCNPAPAFEKNPHSFMLRLNGEPRQTIAIAAQEQVARFLAADGTDVMTADDLNDLVAARACGLAVFEVGVENALEDLMFIP